MIRVLVADDDRLVRQICKFLLARERDIGIVGEAWNGQQAVELAQQLHPDVILMDIQMPVMGGLEAIGILGRVEGFRVLVVSGSSDEVVIARALAKGARGYLIKGEGYCELAAAVRQVHTGGAYFSPSIRSIEPALSAASGMTRPPR